MYITFAEESEKSGGRRNSAVSGNFVRDDLFLQEKAQMLAERLHAEVIKKTAEAEPGGLILTVGSEGLVLTDGKLSLKGDFTTMLPRIRKGRWQHEMLVKAVRIKGAEGTVTVFDATAGMGEDSLLLAAAGFEVHLFERDPVIAVLLEDALHRAYFVPELEEIAARMHFHEGDSVKALTAREIAPDVVYLDPMFPERKKSGLIKKKFQLLQQLEHPCADEEELLGAAINAKPRKIVVKRPAKGPYLADIRPDYSIGGKTIRYDCLVNITADKCEASSGRKSV